jgi:hypothetical protein
MNDTPYDIMVGIWIGTFAIFTSKGERVTAGPSRYKIYWKTPGSLMHFLQDQDLEAGALFGGRADEGKITWPSPLGRPAADAIRNLTIPNYFLRVQGKYATGSGAGPGGDTVNVAGAETTPDVYHFELKEKGSPPSP